MSSDSAQYHYVDFDVDTIHHDQFELSDYPREKDGIQQLSIVGWDFESFYYKQERYLREMNALRDVTIHHWEPGSADNE